MQSRPGYDSMEWIRDFDECQEVLKSKMFRNTLHDGSARWVIGGTLGTLHGDAHTFRRRTESLVFSRSALSTYELELVKPVIEEHLAIVRESASPVLVDVMRLMRSALIRISARLIGLDIETESETETLRLMAESVAEATASEWLAKGVDEAVDSGVQAKTEFKERFFRPAYERRLGLLQGLASGELSEGQLPADLLTMLMRAYEDWDEDLMVAECIFYLGASATTTSNAAPHVLYEILRWVEGHPSDAAKLSDAAFIRACVYEAIRLHPPAPALMRAALEDVTLSSGRILLDDVSFALDLNAVNRTKAVFGDDADEFNPYRVAPKGFAHGAGMSFGIGPHVCLGRLVAAGATAAGSDDTEHSTIGTLVRLMLELFRYNVAIDPEAPPGTRDDTLVDRYSEFLVFVSAPTSVAVDVAGPGVS